ncbi:MAG: endonuclease MutS2, partial [Oscillospiraceae bacterium]
MNDRCKKALELDKILHMLSDEAVCPETKKTALALQAFDNPDEVRMALEETDEMLKILLKFGSPRISGVIGSVEACNRAVKGGVLSMPELLMVASALRNFKYLKMWYGQEEREINILDNIFYCITPQPEIEKNIYESILSETEMADTASNALYEIRQKIRKTESSIREKLDSMIKSQTTQKYLQTQVVALRSGRFVVPVKAEHKGDVQGVIHDVSSSGSTLFVEPTAVVEANAKILQLKNMEKEEIERILAAFSAQIAGIEQTFKQSYESMLAADLLVAKGKLAILQNANKPNVSYENSFSLIRARHPLIDKTKVVPVDIALGESYDTMVITGPNTGG